MAGATPKVMVPAGPGGHLHWDRGGGNGRIADADPQFVE